MTVQKLQTTESNETNAAAAGARSPSARLRAAWPDAVAFQEALQNPSLALHDANLAGGRVATNRLGLPLAYTGRFAAVFRVRDAVGASWAVRCFTSEGEGARRAVRYETIARHFVSLPAPVKAHFVPFQYETGGVRVGGRDYPLLVMGWAKGEPLGKWVEAHHADGPALCRLCRTLSHLLTDLENAQISHGDFQHDNLLISQKGRRAVLVDYDGVWVPPLTGMPPGERGHPNYQHPARTASDFGPHGDRFSVLVLQTALYALSCDPTLWDTFREKSDDALLFSRDDFTDTQNSPVFAVLRLVAHSDPTLGNLLSALHHACDTNETAALFAAETFGPEEDTFVEEELPAVPSAGTAVTAAAEKTESASVLSAADGHKWWVQAAQQTVHRRSKANKIHRGVMWAFTGLLIWLCYDRVQNDVPLSIMIFVAAYLQSLLLAIGYFAWPENFGQKGQHQELNTAQNRVNEHAREVYQVERHLATLNANPANASVVAFVNNHLRDILITTIAAEVGLSWRELSDLTHAGIKNLSDLNKPLQDTVSAASWAKLQIARQKYSGEARADFDVLCQSRRDMQRELDRLRNEHAGLVAIVAELKNKTQSANGATFSRFLGHLLGA